MKRKEVLILFILFLMTFSTGCLLLNRKDQMEKNIFYSEDVFPKSMTILNSCTSEVKLTFEDNSNFLPPYDSLTNVDSVFFQKYLSDQTLFTEFLHEHQIFFYSLLETHQPFHSIIFYINNDNWLQQFIVVNFDSNGQEIDSYVLSEKEYIPLSLKSTSSTISNCNHLFTKTIKKESYMGEHGEYYHKYDTIKKCVELNSSGEFVEVTQDTLSCIRKN